MRTAGYFSLHRSGANLGFANRRFDIPSFFYVYRVLSSLEVWLDISMMIIISMG
jgi:hypothetical protein